MQFGEEGSRADKSPDTETRRGFRGRGGGHPRPAECAGLQAGSCSSALPCCCCCWLLPRGAGAGLFLLSDCHAFSPCVLPASRTETAPCGRSQESEHLLSTYCERVRKARHSVFSNARNARCTEYHLTEEKAEAHGGNIAPLPPARRHHHHRG